MGAFLPHRRGAFQGASNTAILLDGTGDFVSASSSSANNQTGSTTWEGRWRLVDLASPAANQGLFSKYSTSGGNQGVYAHIRTHGDLQFFIHDGTAQSSYYFTDPELNTIYADNAWFDLRITFNNSTSDVKVFHKAPSSGSWTQLDDTVNKGQTAIKSNSADFVVGASYNAINPTEGGCQFFNIYDSDIGTGAGTPVWTMNPVEWVSGSTWTDSVSGDTLTLNGDAYVADL